MKISAVIISFIVLVIGCNNNDSSKSSDSNTILHDDPQIAQGLELIAKSNCFTCHRVSEKLNGPAYVDVAAKYPNSIENVSFLAQKIIKGGSGNWGQILMLPHPDISEDNAKIMAKYILSLKK